MSSWIEGCRVVTGKCFDGGAVSLSTLLCTVVFLLSSSVNCVENRRVSSGCITVSVVHRMCIAYTEKP